MISTAAGYFNEIFTTHPDSKMIETILLLALAAVMEFFTLILETGNNKVELAKKTRTYQDIEPTDFAFSSFLGRKKIHVRASSGGGSTVLDRTQN